MSAHLMVMTTLPSEERARKLGRQLVEKALAACVQILGPIYSLYRWENRLESAEEWLCLVKTRQERYEEVEQAIAELHPYEVPEIVALPFVKGSQRYLSWIDEVTGKRPGETRKNRNRC